MKKISIHHQFQLSNTTPPISRLIHQIKVREGQWLAPKRKNLIRNPTYPNCWHLETFSRMRNVKKMMVNGPSKIALYFKIEIEIIRKEKSLRSSTFHSQSWVGGTKISFWMTLKYPLFQHSHRIHFPKWTTLKAKPVNKNPLDAATQPSEEPADEQSTETGEVTTKWTCIACGMG